MSYEKELINVKNEISVQMKKWHSLSYEDKVIQHKENLSYLINTLS